MNEPRAKLAVVFPMEETIREPMTGSFIVLHKHILVWICMIENINSSY